VPAAEEEPMDEHQILNQISTLVEREQRRARREFGQDADDVQVRSAQQVEKYLR
jgi:hypothetical protein